MTVDMIADLNGLFLEAKQQNPKTIAVAAAEDVAVLGALKRAMDEGIVRPLLVGDREKMERLADPIAFPLEAATVVDNRRGAAESARLAVERVSAGEADFLMKGFVPTGDLLRTVLDKSAGLRTGRLLSHVAFLESPYYSKLLCVTDVAMNVAPGLEAKAQIILNAADVFHAIGIGCPKVAVAAAVETVNPKMEATLHAAALKEMNRNGTISGCVVDGPFAVDIAVNREAALHKGVAGEVAGDCDIMLVPDIEAGNMFYKALNFLGGARSAAVVMGAKVPIVLTSRSDSEQSKFYSIVLASLVGREVSGGKEIHSVF